MSFGALSSSEFPTVESAIVYPVASCSGAHLDRGERMNITSKGPQYDGEWMVVDLDWKPLKNKHNLSKLSGVRPSFADDDDHLLLDAENMETHALSLTPEGINRHEMVLSGQRQVVTVIPGASHWMSDYLHSNVNVVQRIVTPDQYHWNPVANVIGVSNETLSTVDQLIYDSRILNCCRPHLVFSGGKAMQQNDRGPIRIGSSQLERVSRQKVWLGGSVILDAMMGETRLGLVLLTDSSVAELVCAENFAVRKGGVIQIGDPVISAESDEE